MATDDPLEIMRRAMRLQERIAKRELDKGERGNIAKAAEASMSAAMLAKEIAAAEYRLGINSSRPAVTAIEVELVHCAKPEALAAKDERISLLEAHVASLERRLRADTAPVIDVVPNSAAPSNAPALPRPPVETDEERIRRRRRENGDNVDVGWARPAFANEANAYRDSWTVVWQSGDLLSRIK